MHTPRLCIDGRGASEYRGSGLLAQELIDQLVAAQGERPTDELTCDWFEKRRTVLLTHPDQIFSGQLRRYNTKRRIGSSPLAWLWEKHFVKDAHLSAFHRFRPADRLNPIHRISTITTVLPALSGRKSSLENTRRHRFVVPSRQDQADLVARRAAPESISVMGPTVRRFLHFATPPSQPGNRILILQGERKEKIDQAKIEKELKQRFARCEIERVKLTDPEKLSPAQWQKRLSTARVVIYLSTRPFDWPVQAVEALFWKIPALFLDENRAMAELLPQSPLSLSRFFINADSVKSLDGFVELARERLTEMRLFDPLSLARNYRDLYDQLERTVD